MTQIQLSRLIGIGQPALVNWELGRFRPRDAEVRQKLEDVLGAPLHVLLENENGDTQEDAATQSQVSANLKDRYV